MMRVLKLSITPATLLLSCNAGVCSVETKFRTPKRSRSGEATLHVIPNLEVEGGAAKKAGGLRSPGAPLCLLPATSNVTSVDDEFT